VQGGFDGAGWPSEVVGDISFAEIEPIATDDRSAFANREFGNQVPGLVDVGIDRGSSNGCWVSVGDFATPDHRHGSVDHGTLEVADRIVDVGCVGLKTSERVLDDFFGQPSVECDRSGQVHESPGMLPEHRVNVVRPGTVEMPSVVRWVNKHRFACDQSEFLSFSHHTDLTPNPLHRFSRSQYFTDRPDFQFDRPPPARPAADRRRAPEPGKVAPEAGQCPSALPILVTPPLARIETCVGVVSSKRVTSKIFGTW
jgi:hypothetical protein